MARMEQPITRSELREELDRVLVNYATKADLAEMKVDLIKWIVGLQIASIGLTVTILLMVIRLFVGS